MTTNSNAHRVARRAGLLLAAAWPCWLLLLFGCLAAADFLPAGYPRALAAAPIVLFVPGALTLGALPGRHRIEGAFFGCLAVALSLCLAVFASLALYALHILITANSTYTCLLVLCAPLAAVAQLRLLRRARTPRDAAGRAPSGRPGAVRRAGYTLAALGFGAALLGTGTYVYQHAPRPATVGYTWIAWSGPQVTAVIPVGSSGTTLPFQISHQEATADVFRLTAAWAGASGAQHSMATPVTLRIGPDKTMNGKLAIPAPPGGCTYRITVTLTQVGPAHPQSWSVNADVRQRAQAQHGCGS